MSRSPSPCSRIALSRVAPRIARVLASAALPILIASTAAASGCGGGGKNSSERALLPPAGNAGCGVKDAPATKEQCECVGGQLRLDPGDGSVKCADDEQELSRINAGIEGGICCAPRGS